MCQNNCGVNLAGDDKAFLFTVVGVTRCALCKNIPPILFAYSQLLLDKHSLIVAAIHQQHDGTV